jgi:tetratricopeptide (TPR) repeat protein
VIKRPGARPAPYAATLLLAVAGLAAPRYGGAAEPAAVPAPTTAAEFKRLYEAGDYPAAVRQARAVLAEVERSEPVDAEELQVALMNLGLVQRLAGDYLDAEASFRRVIELLEGSGRVTNPRLARACSGLALTYYAARRYDLAAPAFERAIALNRRAEGLFNEDQLPLLDKQADALTEIGRVDDALQAHRYALKLVERRHGAQSLRYAQELVTLGRWYSRVRAYESARYVLRRAVDLVVELKGPDSLELIGPLTAAADNARRWLGDSQAIAAMADEDRQVMYHDPIAPGPPSLSPIAIQSEGLRALERSVEIVDANPDAPPASVAAVRVQLGDLHQIRLAPERALPHYQQAWRAANGVTEGGRPLQQVLFGEPLLLYYAAPDGWSRYASRPAEEVERRNAELEVTVSPQGRVVQSKVTNDAGDPRLAARAQRAAESARYRPRFVDGQPVETAGVRFLQPFYVLRPGVADAPSGGKPATRGEPPPAAPPPAEAAVPEPAQEPAPPQGGG